MTDTEKRNPNTTHIDRADTRMMLEMIQRENIRSVVAVGEALPEIAAAVDLVTAALERGGRLIYVGCGTSGRIACADAAECPPTYGVSYETVTAVIAGGESALVRASENAEDSAEAGRRDILMKEPTDKDVVMGISASGGAAYVVGAMEVARERGAKTVSLSSNPGTKIATVADVAIVTATGPEAITGSTRMKAGSAQKMVLNMITTAAMVKTGHVYENLMINLRPTNEKLRERMISIVCDILGTEHEASLALLEANDFNIRSAVEAYRNGHPTDIS